MGVDEHREHAVGLVQLDEPHAAHVGGEVEDVPRVRGGFAARVALAKVEDPVVHVRRTTWYQSVARLEVNGADSPVATATELGDEVPADESTAARNEDERRRCPW